MIWGPSPGPTVGLTGGPGHKCFCSFAGACPIINLNVQIKGDTSCCQFVTRSKQSFGYWGWSWLRSDWLSAGLGLGPEVGPRGGPELLVDQETFVGQCRYMNQ